MNSNGIVEQESAHREALPACRPFLKWVGGKTQLLPRLTAAVPERFDRYVEPFVGGGALFFRLAATGRIDTAALSDANPILVLAYRAVRDDLESITRILSTLKSAHCRDHYYQARTRFNDPSEMTDAERAATLIYLNRTCYNGLYRVNSKGGFNVPIGRYENPAILQPERLAACSKALQNAEISVADFESALAGARPGDFVYLDPPYVPLTKTSSFTAYARENFNFDDQRRLAAEFRRLDGIGAKVMLSNHATAELIDLYRGFRVVTVPARRALNSRADRRSSRVDEVIITNY